MVAFVARLALRCQRKWMAKQILQGERSDLIDRHRETRQRPLGGSCTPRMLRTFPDVSSTITVDDLSMITVPPGRRNFLTS